MAATGAMIGLLFSRIGLAIAGSLAVCLLALGAIHLLESHGALKERARVMDKLAKERAKDAERIAKAQAELRAEYAKAQAESNAAVAKAAKLQAQYGALPKEGEGVQCPIDCTLPEP